MSDYISREAFLEKERRLYCQDCSRRKNSNGKLVYEIGDAPCRACGIGDVLDDFEDIPAADVRPRWIPVSERLPEEYVNVLCHLRSLDRESEYYSIDHLMEDGQWWKAANSWKHEVTHWMPLPESPEEE